MKCYLLPILLLRQCRLLWATQQFGHGGLDGLSCWVAIRSVAAGGRLGIEGHRRAWRECRC